MDDKKVADYFVVAGLDWSNKPLMTLNEVFPTEAKIPPGQHQDPMVELAVINRSLGETVPDGFKCIEFTPTGFPADLNHGSIRAPEIYLCYRRGRDMPPIIDIGVLYEGKDSKERVFPGCEVIYLTPYGRSANVNNSGGTKIFINFRRASPIAPCDTLVVTEICIILANKGEVAPHAHCVIRKTLNRGMMGSEVHLCYKKSMVKINYLIYKPSILSRYPVDDLPNLPLPQQVSMFCLPMGATLESWWSTNLPPTPVFSTFILTTGLSVEKVYGAAVVFQEPLPQDNVDILDEGQRKVLGLSSVKGGNESAEGLGESRKKDSKELVIYQNKSICLLSRSPFFTTFKKFLFYIYRLVFSKVDAYAHQIPLERHIAHFLSKIPMPCIQRPRIMIQLSSMAIILTQPDETPLPKSGASFVDVLMNLGPTNCILLLLSALMEHKILIHSLRPAVLTGVAEAVAAMIFPLHWQCPYIPLCPLSLSYVLHSPTPFIVGIDSRYFDTYELPTDVTCVDLDTNTLTISEDRRSHTLKMLPKKPTKQLKSTLERLYERLSECPEILTPTLPREGTLDVEDAFFKEELIKKKQMQMELSIREAYLRFMASTLKGYNHFLLPITNAPTDGAMDLNSLFDIIGFVKSRDKSYHKFYALLMKTQTFSRFIEERSFVSDKDSSLAFFDYCLERVDDENQRLIEVDENLMGSERTVLIMGPEPDDLDQTPISYQGYFPGLDPSKFPDDSETSHLASASHPSNPDCVAVDQVSSFHHLGSKVLGYNSPMVCRTQHEVKQSLKVAMKHANVPGMWARSLTWHCYSLWFIHLSSYSKSVHSKSKVLRNAYEILIAMQSAKLQPPDEVCYRVLMQLCGIYHLPVLAVKVLFEMKRKGIQPNAITYGFYNKAVLESKWPTSNSTADQLWTKLRNVILAVSQFKKGSSSFMQCTPIAQFNIGQSRAPLVNSNSESDPERQSMDSYLDSVGVETSNIAISRSTNIVSNIIGSPQNLISESMANQVLGGEKFTVPSSPSKSPTLDAKQLGDEVRKNNNVEDSTNQKSPSKLRSESQSNQSAGSRQRARSTSEVGGDIDLIGAIRHRSKESISAGGLSDRGYGSLSMEETKDSTIFPSLSHSIKCKETHKSAEVSHNFSDDVAMTTAYSNRSPEKLNTTGSMESLPLLPVDLQSRSSNASSSVRIPVTQNDPLGLFSPPTAPEVSAPNDASRLGERSKTHSLDRPLLFTSPSFQQSSDGDDESERRPSVKGVDLPVEVMNRMQAGQRQSIKTPAWVAMAAENVVGGGSELLGSAIKMVTNKFSRYRDVITSTGGGRSTGGRAESMGSLNSGESDCSYPGADKRQIEVIQVHDSEAGIDVCMPTQPKRSSVTFQEMPGKNKKGSPFVSNLWNGLKTLQRSETFKGLASGLSQMSTTVKATVKDTLTTEVWGLPNNMAFGMMAPNIGVDFSGRSIDEDEEEEDDDDERQGKSFPPLQLDNPYMSTVSEDHQCKDPGSHHQNNNTGSLSSIPSTVSQSAVPPNPYVYPVQVEMSTLNKCSKCLNLLYDEEIMAGWTADDSNLNTCCQFCTSQLVPFINIYIRDYRPFLKTQPPSNLSQSSESILSCHSSTANQHQSHIHLQPASPNTATSVDFMPSDPLPDQSSECARNVEDGLIIDRDSKFNEATLPTMEANATTPRRCASTSSLPEITLILLPPSNKMVGSVDALNDTRNNRSQTTDETMSRSHNGILSAAGNDFSKNFIDLEPLCYPYLSPLVLRKEVENVLVQEGDACFDGDSMLDGHPILFWNLVWYFKRLDIPSHLPSLVATSKSLNQHLQGQQQSPTSQSKHSVYIKAMWDNVRLHVDHGPPMYILWNQSLSNPNNIFNKSMMTTMVECIMKNDVTLPLRLILSERDRHLLTLQSTQVQSPLTHVYTSFHSIYRDLLFLSFMALGRDNIDVDAFDKEFKNVLTHLSPNESARLRVADRVPRTSAISCRKMFKDLAL